MDVTKLPFNADAMLAGLKPSVELREPHLGRSAHRRDDGCAHPAISPSLGARHRADRAAAWGSATACARRSATGDASKPGILIMGHLDTVHPVGTLAKNCRGGARAREMLRPRHLRHEGRQLHRARSSAAGLRAERRDQPADTSYSPAMKKSVALRRAT